MTILQRRRPRPFLRLTRADYEQLLAALYDQRDRAIAGRRADRDRVAALIEGAADSHATDAQHLDRLTGQVKGAATEKLTAAGHRAVEHVLRDLARDVCDEIR